MEHERALIVVAHGSRRAASNERFVELVAEIGPTTGFAVVEPALMELAEPSIGTAYDRCVERGASTVVVCPFFLLPGNHWDRDIPALTAEAAGRHPGTQFLVTAPVGLHPAMAVAVQATVDRCVAHAAGDAPACDLCAGTDHCALRS